MNWMNKLERKLGKYAVPNLIVWLLGAYVIGFVMQYLNPTMLAYLNFQPQAIMHGQVWRLVTWVFQPTDSNVLFMLIMMMFYYQLGRALENTWGTFRFNVYIFGGIIMTAVGTLIIYGLIYLFAGAQIASVANYFMASIVSTTYVNMSIFLAFAAMYPDMQVMLYFIIPIKMKWMAYVYIAIIGFNLIEIYRTVMTAFGSVTTAIVATLIMAAVIIMSLLNFLIFFFSSRNYQRISPKEVHRRRVYRAATREPRRAAGVTKHKCAICGRTEESNPELEFRFCSKCDGNYEYCQDHLFTHQHIKMN